MPAAPRKILLLILLHIQAGLQELAHQLRLCILSSQKHCEGLESAEHSIVCQLGVELTVVAVALAQPPYIQLKHD